MHALAVLFTIAACGGEESKPVEAAKPPEAPKAVEPAPPPPAPAPAAAAGPYAPDDLAKAAYEKAKAAGADSQENPKKGKPEAIAAGKTEYETKCVTCHGAKGDGMGIAGSALPQKPAQFAWKERWDATSIGVKHWTIMNGIQGTAMAPLGLSDDQAWDVLAYIESEFQKQ